MTTGTAGSFGSLNVEWRRKTGTLSPGRARASHVDATPSCTRPVGSRSKVNTRERSPCPAHPHLPPAGGSVRLGLCLAGVGQGGSRGGSGHGRAPPACCSPVERAQRTRGNAQSGFFAALHASLSCPRSPPWRTRVGNKAVNHICQGQEAAVWVRPGAARAPDSKTHLAREKVCEGRSCLSPQTIDQFNTRPFRTPTHAQPYAHPPRPPAQ